MDIYIKNNIINSLTAVKENKNKPNDDTHAEHFAGSLKKMKKMT
jgi:hypothetical protein